MKVALVVPADFIGGAELFAVDFARFHHDTVVIHGGNSQFSALLPSITRQITMDFPRLKKWSLASLWRYLKSSTQLAEILAKIEPDLVLSNSVRAHLLSARALQNSVLPLVFFGHDFTFPQFFLRWAERRANKIYACSDAVKKDLIAKGATPAKIEVFYNGVDLHRFDKQKKHLEQGRIKVGIIGRIDEWKGQDLFVEAARQLSELDFIVYGESSDYDPATLEFENRLKSNPPSNLTFAGFVPAQKALTEIDILVHASKKQEPFGRVILEAMAVGVPVISTNAELINDGENGVLIPKNNLDSLVRKIRKVAENRPWRFSLALNARQTVEQKFNLLKTMGTLTKKLRDLCL